MSFNQRGLYGTDVRRSFSGKDCLVFDESGNILATAESWQSKTNIITTNYQPLGSPIQQSFITGYSIQIVMTQVIVEDDKFIQDLFEFFEVGRHPIPIWGFQSTIYGYDGSESRIIYREVVPSGDIDLHNLNISELVKRQFNLIANAPPELQKMLTAG